ncbi:unnamed protein product, partial [Rotaria magnacalcarata]
MWGQKKCSVLEGFARIPQ